MTWNRYPRRQVVNFVVHHFVYYSQCAWLSYDRFVSTCILENMLDDNKLPCTVMRTTQHITHHLGILVCHNHLALFNNNWIKTIDSMQYIIWQWQLGLSRVCRVFLHLPKSNIYTVSAVQTLPINIMFKTNVTTYLIYHPLPPEFRRCRILIRHRRKPMLRGATLRYPATNTRPRFKFHT